MDYGDILEFEDKMDEAEIFTNGFRENTPAHRDSYMTVMDFKKMQEFLLKERDNYDEEEWIQLKEHFWYSGEKGHPMDSLVASQIDMHVLQGNHCKNCRFAIKNTPYECFGKLFCDIWELMVTPLDTCEFYTEWKNE